MGLHFYKSLLECGRTFSGFGGQKIQVCRDLKIERCLTIVSVHFRMTKLKRLYKVDP